jgi:cell division septum initiation protein DivIVA
MENRGNIVAAYAHEAGIPVTSFEIGTVDRNQSRTGQGFLNLVDASVDQFQRIIRLRKEASVLKNEIATQTDWSQKKIKAAEDRIKVLGNMSRQWTTNWAGAQQIIQVDEGGNLVAKDQFAAVNAPCGRFTMVIDGKSVSVDLWKNSARAESAPMTSASNAVIAEASDEELPF